MNIRDEATGVKELSHYIGGEHIAGQRGRFGEVFNPTSGSVVARVPLASKADTEYAIANSLDTVKKEAIN